MSFLDEALAAVRARRTRFGDDAPAAASSSDEGGVIFTDADTATMAALLAPGGATAAAGTALSSADLLGTVVGGLSTGAPATPADGLSSVPDGYESLVPTAAETGGYSAVPNSTPPTTATTAASIPSTTPNAALQTAANAIFADPTAASGAINMNVLAFQIAYDGTDRPLGVIECDGRYSALTQQALAPYGTAPALPTAPMGTGVEVARTKTPVAAQAFADTLAALWPSVIGGAPSATAIQLLLAQSDFETGAWNYLWNWNFGNVKHVPGDGYDYFTMTVKEGSGSSTVTIPQLFRSYPSLATGAKSYLSFMHTARCASPGWPYALAGDAAGFVTAIRNAGYFTGALSDYIAGVKARLSKYTSLIPSSAGSAAAWAGDGDNADGASSSDSGDEDLATLIALALVVLDQASTYTVNLQPDGGWPDILNFQNAYNRYAARTNRNPIAVTGVPDPITVSVIRFVTAPGFQGENTAEVHRILPIHHAPHTARVDPSFARAQYLAHVRKAKDDLRRYLSRNGRPSWLAGIGIGSMQNSGPPPWTPCVKVLVNEASWSAATLRQIPHRVYGVPVRIEATGPIVPQGSVGAEPTAALTAAVSMPSSPPGNLLASRWVQGAILLGAMGFAGYTFLRTSH